MKKTLLFAIRPYLYLRDRIARCGSYEKGKVEVKTFPDGERYQRIRSEVNERDVILVGGTISDEATLELYDLACALSKYGARKLTLVIPYFGYSTMERAIKPGEIVTAKTRARLLSSIPAAHAGNRILFLDLHSEGLPHYLEGGISPSHVYAKDLVIRAARKLGKGKFVLASTDAGRANWVQSLADDMKVNASFVFKRRLDGSRTTITAVSAHVKDLNVVIYDDMIRTGGSLLGAARAYRDAGAARISAVTTHGLFPGDSLQRIEESGLINEVIATDSLPRAIELESKFLTVVSTAKLFHQALAK